MGLRTRLLLLVLLPVIPALVLALYTGLEQRRFGMFKVEKDAISVVHLAAASQVALIEATRQHLAALSRFPQARGTNVPNFDAFFATMPKVYTNYTDFGLVETTGELVSSSFGRSGPTNLADRAHIQRVLKTHDFAVGNYQAGDGARNPSFLFGHPVFDERGRVARLVYAGLDLGVLNNAVAKAELPEGGVIHVFDRSGNVLASYPAPEKWTGQSVLGSPLMTTLLSKQEGTAELPGLDGVSRLYAFLPVRNGQEAALFLSVGIPTTLAYGEMKRSLIRNLGILGTVALVVLLATLIYANSYVLRPVNALVAATRRLTRGDLTARTGIVHSTGELNQLARAFDEMAESVERQRSELERSEKEIRALNAGLEQRVVERTRELESANEELEAFSYTVSHDLHAPLRSIDGFVRILRKDASASLNESARQCLETISSSARQMGVLIDDLLSFSRAGRTELCRTRVNLGQLVAEVIRELHSDTQNRNIEWKIDPLPEADADGPMLKLVWANLLSNAVKYTRRRERAEIQIRCRQNSPAEFEFSVRDNGAGFDMRYSGKLFRVFERLHDSTEFEGSGIGLASVQRIVARHGGRTWGEGKVDEGATFYFTLPAKQSA